MKSMIVLCSTVFALAACIDTPGLSDAGLGPTDGGIGLPDAGLPDSGVPDSGVPDSGMPDSGMPDAGDAGPLSTPPTPPLGTQLDRMGRPLVTATLVVPLDSDAFARSTALHRWNTAGDRFGWQDFVDPFAISLATFDGLDGECGNQMRAGPSSTFDRYDNLASFFADDRVFVDTRWTVCNEAFAVERPSLGMASVADCGGRAPALDMVDPMLSLLAGTGLSGWTDGLDPANSRPVSSAVFPFLMP